MPPFASKYTVYVLGLPGCVTEIVRVNEPAFTVMTPVREYVYVLASMETETVLLPDPLVAPSLIQETLDDAVQAPSQPIAKESVEET